MLGSLLFSSVTGLPSAASASRVSASLVQLLRRYYARVRLLARVHARIMLLASRADPVAGWPRMPARSLGSRACSFSTCSWLLDYAGPDGNSRWRSHQCCLPVRSTRSASEMRFSKLDSRPVDPSVYASPGTSRHPAQDSRSRWFATPFFVGLFHPRLHAGLSRRLRSLAVTARCRIGRNSAGSMRASRASICASSLSFFRLDWLISFTCRALATITS